MPKQTKSRVRKKSNKKVIRKAKKSPLKKAKKKKSAQSSYAPSPWAEVQGSEIHGKGLFARKRIPKDTCIGFYEGTKTKKDGTYVLWLEDYGIDGKNDLRYVNHSSKPNAIFEDDELWSLKSIPAGREITFHYGADWEDVD